MARTPAQTAALIKKATAAENKSDGMRQLFDAGLGVTEIKEAFGAPYGFVYGVGVRHGAITPTAREAKAATKATKAPAKAAAKATTAKAAPRAKAPAAKAATKRAAAAKA